MYRPLVAGGIAPFDLRLHLAPGTCRTARREGIESHPPCLLLQLCLPAPLGFPPFGRRGLALLADRHGAGAQIRNGAAAFPTLPGPRRDGLANPAPDFRRHMRVAIDETLKSP